jgi:hypothetical protein
VRPRTIHAVSAEAVRPVPDGAALADGRDFGRIHHGYQVRQGPGHQPAGNGVPALSATVTAAAPKMAPAPAATWRRAATHREDDQRRPEEPPAGPYTWQEWSFDWHAADPGRYTLRARATDAAGNTQPDVPPWNRLGYGNNAVEVM